MSTADTPIAVKNQFSGIPDADLTARYHEVRADREKLSAVLTAIKMEMARRDGSEKARKKLQGASPEEREALRKLLDQPAEVEEPTDLE